MQIHINRDGQNFGPYTLDEARQYLASGNLIETDLAWFEGAANWMPLSQVPGVAPARPAGPVVAAGGPVSAPVAGAVAAPATGSAITYAGFWRRVVAYLIDGLLVGVVSVAMPLLVFAVIGSIAGSTEAASATLAMVGLSYGGTLIAMWLYFALLESSPRQATLGKMAVGLIVTDFEGRRIGFGRATGRYFGKILSALILGIGFLMAGFTERKQALHDMLATTLVVNKDPADTGVPWWGWVVIVLSVALPYTLELMLALAP
ncbi:MAG: RDD family protein [Pseudomonadota bacterium]